MAIKPRAQLHINAAGRMRKNIRAQPAQHHLKQCHHHKSDGNHIERTETTMHQHLVHHYLKKERGNQREQLQHNRYRQHLQKNPAVLNHRRNKPGEIKLGERTQDGGTRGDQNQLPGKARGKICQRQQKRLARRQILNQKLSVIHPRQNKMLSVRLPHHRRQSQQMQPGYRTGNGAHLQTQITRRQ